jgi:hypothetical protein
MGGDVLISAQTQKHGFSIMSFVTNPMVFKHTEAIYESRHSGQHATEHKEEKYRRRILPLENTDI